MSNSGDETKSSSSIGTELAQSSWEEKTKLNTPERAWYALNDLFEKRVKGFNTLHKMVEIFKEDLNMARFKESVPAVTDSFSKISAKIRFVESSLL